MNASFVRFASLLAALFTLSAVSALAEEAAADPALEILYTANTLYNRGLPGPARAQFELFLRRHRNHERARDARMGRALCWVAEGEGERAVDELRALARERNFERREEMRAVLANLLLQLDKPGEALNEARGLATDTGDEALKDRARTTWSEAAFLLEDWRQVVTAAQPPLNDRMRYQLGFALFQDKGPEDAEAVAALTPVAEGDTPYTHNAAMLLGRIHQARAEMDRAAAAYRRAAYDVSGPQSADAGWAAALIAWQGEDDAAAATALEAFQEHFPEHPRQPRAALLLGRVREQLERIEPARAAFATAMESEETRYEAAVRRLRLLATDGERTPVLTAALAWPADQEWTPILLLDQARIDQERERPEAAIERLRQLIDDFPQSPLGRDARLNLIDLLEATGQHAEAATACVAFARDYPDDPETGQVRFLAARNFVQADDVDQAMAQLVGLLADRPAAEIDTPARLLLARLYTRREQWADTVTVLAPLREATHGAALHLSGMAADRLEQWADATAWLRAFLAAAPADRPEEIAEARLALARALEADGKPAEAVPELVAFVNGRTDDERVPYVLLTLARLHEDMEALDPARAALEQITGTHAASPAAPLAWAERLRLAVLTEQPQQALEAARQLVALHPDHALAVDGRLQTGRLHYQLEQYAEAEQAMTDFLNRHADHPEADHALYLKAMAALRQEQWLRAEQDFTSFLTQFKDSAYRPQALYEQAWLKRRDDRSDEAIGLYQTLLTEAPEDALAGPARAELADLLRADGRGEEALGLLAGLSDDDPRAALLQAWVLMEAGRFTEAAVAFAAAAPRQDQPDARRTAWMQAGEARLKDRDYAAALQAFEAAAAVEGAEDLPLLWLRLAETRALNERWDESATAAGQFLERFPDDPLRGRAMYQSGWALENQGRFEEAIARYHEWVDTGDSSPVAARCLFQIGECHLALEQLDDAIGAFAQVALVHHVPEVAAPALLQLAETLRRNGQAEAAENFYRELIETYPDSSAAALARERIGAEQP
jgi:TolA-binding protein